MTRPGRELPTRQTNAPDLRFIAAQAAIAIRMSAAGATTEDPQPLFLSGSPPVVTASVVAAPDSADAVSGVVSGIVSASVGCSVGISVGASVGSSVGASVGVSVGSSVGYLVNFG